MRTVFDICKCFGEKVLSLREKFLVMKAIIRYFKSIRERRLRERCVKYASKSMCQGDNAYHIPNIAKDIYLYISEGKLV